MKPERAAQKLQDLRRQADTPKVRRAGPEHRSWKAKVDSVIEASPGKNSETLRDFRELSYHIGIYFGAPGEADADARYFAEQAGHAAGLIDAAIYQLDLQDDPGEALVVTSLEATGPIFVVHGRDDAHKHELMRLLEQTVERKRLCCTSRPTKARPSWRNSNGMRRQRALPSCYLPATTKGAFAVQIVR